MAHVWRRHNPCGRCCGIRGGRGNSMVREVYFLSVECNELDRK